MPLQGPFTKQHVGGLIGRNVPALRKNILAQNVNRSEVFSTTVINQTSSVASIVLDSGISNPATELNDKTITLTLGGVSYSAAFKGAVNGSSTSKTIIGVADAFDADDAATNLVTSLNLAATADGLPLVASISLAGANVIKIECLSSENFLNNLNTILTSQKVKAVLVSFPHNPTTLTVNQEFYDELVNLARRYNFLIINDFAYSDIYFNEEKPPSLLNSDPQFDHTVELYSLTKGYSMAGWRVGFAVGNESAISSLTKLKSYIDYGTFQPIQIASTVAINELDDYPKEVSSIYQDRKILAEEYLTKYGFEVYKSTATMFLWAKLPEVYKNDSMKFSIDLLSKSNVAVSPGVGFGNCGEGHIRLALVENKQRIRQAMKNFAKIIDSV